MATKSLIHAFITSRLDYANRILYGVPHAQMNRLQKIENFAARVIFKTRRFDHISPVLKEVHWLPISKRIEFKILVHTFNSIHQTAPSYLADVISPYTPSRTLRSSDGNLLLNYQTQNMGKLLSKMLDRSCGTNCHLTLGTVNFVGF